MCTWKAWQAILWNNSGIRGTGPCNQVNICWLKDSWDAISPSLHLASFCHASYYWMPNPTIHLSLYMLTLAVHYSYCCPLQPSAPSVMPSQLPLSSTYFNTLTVSSCKVQTPLYYSYVVAFNIIFRLYNIYCKHKKGSWWKYFLYSRAQLHCKTMACKM